MTVRLPDVPARAGLGVGLDLPWGSPRGFVRDAARGDGVADPVARFLQAHAGDFASLFVSWQPQDRNRLDPTDYHGAYDNLFARSPAFPVRALHHTALNLGADEPYDRAGIVAFTNALIQRYGFAWVNEDLGLWSLGGRPLPYPLPPWLTDAGLRAAVRNTAAVQADLAAPLSVEFPGFSDGTSVAVGRWHAYDFFRRVVEETGSPATLDTGHLLSYQWLLGRRGADLLADLDRLPLAHCIEVHLSGCEVVDDRFVDYHHGILLDAQLDLLALLLPCCPALRVVTYEDPRFDPDGVLDPRAVANFDRLRAMVARWSAEPAPVHRADRAARLSATPPRPLPASDAPSVGTPSVGTPSAALDRLLRDRPARDAFLTGRTDHLCLGPADAAAFAAIDRHQLARTADGVRDALLERSHRGCGDLLALYPRTLAAFAAIDGHPRDRDLAELSEAFLASPACDGYRELPFAAEGASLEEAFYRFAEAQGVGDPADREAEFLGAMVRALATSPRAAFALPPEVHHAPGGYFAVATRGAIPVLYATARAQVVTGALTPFLADLLVAGAEPAAVALRHGVDAGVLATAVDRLSALGLVW